MRTNRENKQEDPVKEVYKKIREVINQNPELYLMTKTQYNSIIKAIERLQAHRDRLIKQRERWKRKFLEKKGR